MIDVAHTFIDIFAPGLSASRVYILFVVILVCVLGFLSLRFLGKNLLVKNTIFDRYGFKHGLYVFSVLISILFIANVCIYAHFAYIHDVSFRDRITVINHQEISFARLSHTHVLKSVIGTPTYLIWGNHTFDQLDPGTAYIGLINPWIVGVIISAYTFLLLLAYYIFLVGLKERRYTQSVIFTLLAFLLLSGVLDGGLFTNYVVLYLGALITLLFDRRYIRYGVSLIFLILQLTVAYLMYHLEFDNNFLQVTLSQVANIIVMWFLCFLPVCISGVSLSKAYRWAFGIMYLVLFSLFIIYSIFISGAYRDIGGVIGCVNNLKTQHHYKVRSFEVLKTGLFEREDGNYDLLEQGRTEHNLYLYDLNAYIPTCDNAYLNRIEFFLESSGSKGPFIVSNQV